MNLELIFLLLPFCLIGMAYAVGDKLLTITRALPNGAANVSSTPIDLQHGLRGRLLADVEFVVEAPAMNTTQMPNAKTMIYSIETDDNAAFSSAKIVNPALITQTGAGGAGCAAATERFRLPTNCEQYVRVKATGSASGDATGASFVFALKG